MMQKTQSTTVICVEEYGGNKIIFENKEELGALEEGTNSLEDHTVRNVSLYNVFHPPTMQFHYSVQV
jgi:hypothetical protein